MYNILQTAHSLHICPNVFSIKVIVVELRATFLDFGPVTHISQYKQLSKYLMHFVVFILYMVHSYIFTYS